MQALRSVSGQVLADAGASVYGSWCPSAAAKFANLETHIDESLKNVTQRIVKRCSHTDGNRASHKNLADFARSSMKPLVKKVAEALTEAKSCGCKKITCTWCKPGQAVSTPGELAAQYMQKKNETTKKAPVLTFKLPKLLVTGTNA